MVALLALLLGTTACPASLEPIPTGKESSKIKLTRDKDDVRGCKRLGTVEGWRDAEKQNRAYVLAAGAGAYAGGAHPDLYVLYRDGGDDEVYLCGGTPTPTPTRVPVATPIPQPTSSRVRIVATEAEVQGCTFRGSIDSSIPCPPEYPQGVPCMAYRASRQEGNTVLASGAGKIFDCPVDH